MFPSQYNKQNQFVYKGKTPPRASKQNFFIFVDALEPVILPIEDTTLSSNKNVSSNPTPHKPLYTNNK